MRWGDKKGGYGEHYWDLNHAGHNNDNDDGNYDRNNDHSGHDHDDGSYNERNTNDAYDEPSDQTLNYNNDAYDPEKSSQYDEKERSKRAHYPRGTAERKTPIETQDGAYRRNIREGKRPKPVRTYEEPEENNEEEYEEAEEPTTTTTRRPALKKKIQRTEAENEEFDSAQPSDSKKVTLEDVHEPYQKPQKTQEHFVPYEGGAGVRQHYQAAAAPPRLFLEPSTGHVVDRATGQAYVLQPIIPINNY